MKGRAYLREKLKVAWFLPNKYKIIIIIIIVKVSTPFLYVCSPKAEGGEKEQHNLLNYSAIY